MNQRVCETHLPHVSEIAEIGLGLWLVEYKMPNATGEKYYGLMAPQGCSLDDVIFWFPEKPYPDPDPVEAVGDDTWIDKCNLINERLIMDANEGHYLIEACKIAGWRTERQDECGYGGCLLSCWLMQYCGKLIQAWEANGCVQSS